MTQTVTLWQPSDTSKATPSTADMTPRSRLDENSAAFKEKLAKFETGNSLSSSN